MRNLVRFQNSSFRFLVANWQKSESVNFQLEFRKLICKSLNLHSIMSFRLKDDFLANFKTGIFDFPPFFQFYEEKWLVSSFFDQFPAKNC